LQNRLNGHKIGAGELALRTSPSPGIPNKPKGGQNMFAQNDVNFTDKKWVWVPDNKEGYIAGYIINEEAGSDVVNVRLVNGRETTININDTEKVNPPKFDRVDDMADLGYLNEASVVHNLKQRFFDDLIYTYSGLFLVAVNPYYPLPIYGREYISGYKNKKRNE
ncbi:class II myosin, partial [Spiromyces aspiralis]